MARASLRAQRLIARISCFAKAPLPTARVYNGVAQLACGRGPAILELCMKAVVLLSALLSLPALAAEPTLYGRYEYLQLPEWGRPSRQMDTGAYTLPAVGP